MLMHDMIFLVALVAFFAQTYALWMLACSGKDRYKDKSFGQRILFPAFVAFVCFCIVCAALSGFVGDIAAGCALSVGLTCIVAVGCLVVRYDPQDAGEKFHNEPH